MSRKAITTIGQAAQYALFFHEELENDEEWYAPQSANPSPNSKPHRTRRKTPAPRRRDENARAGSRIVKCEGCGTTCPATRREHDIATCPRLSFSILHEAKNNTDGLDPPGMPVSYFVVGSEANVWRNSETFVIFTIPTLLARAEARVNGTKLFVSCKQADALLVHAGSVVPEPLSFVELGQLCSPRHPRRAKLLYGVPVGI